MRWFVPIALVLGVFSQQALAQITMKGTIPSGRTPVVIIQPNNETKTSGVIKFKFSAPTAGAYTLNFCIGPASNPCGTSSDYVVSVPGGEERLAVVDASVFVNNELVVTQGTSSALPYGVTIE